MDGDWISRYNSSKTIMKTALTPKDLAAAIGVSESSLRRWVDSGVIATQRTVGGHRRIPLAEAVRFIRDSHALVVRPELLGMAELDARVAAPGQEEGERLFAALEAGDAARAMGLVLAFYTAGASIPTICDGPVRYALSRLGELWQHNSRGILIEHRATAICVQILGQLRQVLGPPKPESIRAVGGAPSGDPYLLPSMMVGLVLADAGFREVNYGPDVPINLLGDASEEHGARVVWLSFSAPFSRDLMRREVVQLAERLAAAGRSLVIGGRRCDDLSVRDLPCVHQVRSMAELAAFAKGMMTGQGKTGPQIGAPAGGG